MSKNDEEAVAIRRLPAGTKLALLGHAQRAGHSTLESWLRNLLQEQAAQPPEEAQIDQTEHENMRIQYELAGRRWRSIQEKIKARQGTIREARAETEGGKGGRLGKHVRALLQIIDEIEQEVS